MKYFTLFMILLFDSNHLFNFNIIFDQSKEPTAGGIFERIWLKLEPKLSPQTKNPSYVPTASVNKTSYKGVLPSRLVGVIII